MSGAQSTHTYVVLEMFVIDEIWKAALMPWLTFVLDGDLPYSDNGFSLNEFLSYCT